jgi:hypothetical protein
MALMLLVTAQGGAVLDFENPNPSTPPQATSASDASSEKDKCHEHRLHV